MSNTCPRCANECRPRARFCDACGNELPPLPAERIEIRLCSVLFCDLAHSTQLANRLDPEDLHLVFKRLYATVREVAKRHGGYLLRPIGDALVVVFGYPAAHEDSAESAALAGLDCVASIQSAPAPVTLQVHVGIASGTVVMGEFTSGTAFDEQLVTGSVANLAARLGAAASPATVVLCDVSRRLVGKRFELEAVDFSLAGLPAPVRAWRVLAESDRASRFQALRAAEGPVHLIGRDAALENLSACWAEAVEGRSQAVELVGEAGVGKSSLVNALQRQIGGSETLQLELHCTPRTQNAPLFAVRRLLRRMAVVQANDNDATALQRVSALLGQTLEPGAVERAARQLRLIVCPAEVDLAQPDSAELERERAIALLAEWIKAVAERRPVLIVVEDLHWTDPTTLLVLRRLIEQGGSWAIMLVVTRRPQSPASVSDLPRVQQVCLDPLHHDDAVAMVGRLVPEGVLPPEAIDAIVERAEGNPLFLEELARDSLEQTSSKSRGLVPASLHNLIQARLDRLPALSPMVQAAAVLGREFSADHLRLIHGADPARLAASVEQLVREGILEGGTASATDSLRFRHALIHDAVYQTLLRGERHRLHRLAARMLEEEYGPGGRGAPPADLLAHHWAQAGQPQQAVPYLVHASRTTALHAAYQESIAHAHGGLQLVDQIDDRSLGRRLRRALLAQLGHSLTATLGYAAPQVEQAFAEARDLGDDETQPDEQYPIVRGLGSYYLVRGRTSRADTLAQQCVELAQRADRADLLIDALAFAAYPAYFAGRLAESQELLERALELYDSEQGARFVYPNVQEPGTAAWALLSTVCWLRGDFAGAERAAEALLAHLRQLQRPFDDVFGKVWLAATRLLQRQPMQAAALAQEGLALAQAHGFGTWVPAAVMHVCMAQGMLQAAAEAAATLQQVHQAFVAAGAEVSYPYYCWGIAQTLYRMGDDENALAAVQRGLQGAEAGEEKHMLAELRLLAARAAPSTEQAASLIAAAYREAQAQGATTLALRAACMRHRDHTDAAAAARARALLQILDGERPAPDEPDFATRALAELREAVGSDEAFVELHPQRE
jgi:class 3 adenylate cyclase